MPSCRWQLCFSHRIFEPVGTLGLLLSGSRSRRNRDAPIEISLARALGDPSADPPPRTQVPKRARLAPRARAAHVLREAHDLGVVSGDLDNVSGTIKELYDKAHHNLLILR